MPFCYTLIMSTIYNQIKKLDKWALMSWGARDIVYSGDNKLDFKVGRRIVSIEVVKDEYKITLYSFSMKKGLTVLDTMEGILVENLVFAIDKIIKE